MTISNQPGFVMTIVFDSVYKMDTDFLVTRRSLYLAGVSMVLERLIIVQL